MANRLKLLALAGLVAAVASPALAQSSATVTVNSTGRIIAPITLVRDANLVFGTIIRPSTGSGTVTIGTTADTVAVTGGVVAMGSTASRAKFTVGGEGGQTYAITVPASFNLVGPSSTNLPVTLTSSATTGTLSGALGASGSQSFQVGGAFTVADTQTTGNYAGTFDVTVAYN